MPSFHTEPASRTPTTKGPYFFLARYYGDELEKLWNNHQGGPGRPEYYPHFENVELYKGSSLDGERLWCEITLLAKPEYNDTRIQMEAPVHVGTVGEAWVTKVIFRPHGIAGVVEVD